MNPIIGFDLLIQKPFFHAKLVSTGGFRLGLPRLPPDSYFFLGFDGRPKGDFLFH